ncbi:MAG TPA: EcsC family protein [Candidatus Lustribacter sp.]|nr:EcsC family protein [Candidatus Lustribacter sp.]
MRSLFAMPAPEGTPRREGTVAEAPRSALDQADRQSALEEPSVLGGAATRLVERLLSIGIDGAGPVRPAREAAQAALRKHGTAERGISAIITSHVLVGGAGGFLTGLGGFVTVPVAVPVNVTEFYLVATRMVASIASARGYDVDEPNIRLAVLLTLVGADSDDLLRKAGVAAAGPVSRMVAQRLPGPALMMLNKGVGFRLIAQVGRSGPARFGRAIPLIGGGVSAGLDVYLLAHIARHAKAEFPPRAG